MLGCLTSRLREECVGTGPEAWSFAKTWVDRQRGDSPSRGDQLNRLSCCRPPGRISGSMSCHSSACCYPAVRDLAGVCGSCHSSMGRHPLPDFESIHSALTKRLDEADRGDRGWFLITRVHLSPARVKGLCDYIRARSQGLRLALRQADYARMATLANVSSADPGVVIRRHHLLALERPLQLIQRTKGTSWAEIEMTDLGRRLADSENPNEVLEQALENIMFCRSPWYPDTRVEQYSEFDIAPYSVTKSLLNLTGGFIDRDEFDLFTSRIRLLDEVEPAADLIVKYRLLAESHKSTLRYEVRDRMPSGKTYQNWRDIGLHTFSLFSLGSAVIRDGDILRLASNAVADQWDMSSEGGESVQPALAPLLAVPEAPISEELLAPPAPTATNSGADAELLVAKLLRASGWSVAYYTNKRGFGFDLWAQRSGVGLVVEVKSSIGSMGAVVLTRTEYEAAVYYGANFVLAIVEDVLSARPVLRVIRNPVSSTEIVKQETHQFTIGRASWEAAASADAF